MVRNGFLLILMVFLAGCGEVEWFPEYVRQPTTPDEFSFPAKTGTALSTETTPSEITSAPITVSGLTAATSTISITGSVGSNSKYSINGASPTDVAGTVKNGDKVTVTHTSAKTLATSTVSTLTIGNVSGKFTSTTRTVDIVSEFTEPEPDGSFVRSEATFESTSGTHVVSIKDSLGSTDATFSIVDANGNLTTFTNQTRTIAFLAQQRIFVRNLPSATTITTLTIDDVEFNINLVIP